MALPGPLLELVVSYCSLIDVDTQPTKSNEQFEPPVLVMDLGEYFTRAGFSGDDSARAVFPSVLGRHKYGSVMTGCGTKDCFLGDEALSRRGVLALRQPKARGIVQDWNDVEKFFHHSCYNELCMAPEEHPVLMTEKALTSSSERETLTSMLFEMFYVPALCLALDSVLGLFGQGSVSGLDNLDQ